jgi:hypothetical protein
MDELGVIPRGRGISPETTAFLHGECTGTRALTAAPVALGVIIRDPGGEPPGLVGGLVEDPPQGSLAVRKFALETIGLTNRPDYVPLLARIAAEPVPFAAPAIRAAALIDGGSTVLRRAIEAQPDHPHAAALIQSLRRTVDHEAAADLVRHLAARGDPGSLEIALRVMAQRGALPDLEPIIEAAATRPALSDAARADARQALEELNPRTAGSITAMNPPPGNPAEQTTPVETGGR